MPKPRTLEEDAQYQRERRARLAQERKPKPDPNVHPRTGEPLPDMTACIRGLTSQQQMDILQKAFPDAYKQRPAR